MAIAVENRRRMAAWRRNEISNGGSGSKQAASAKGGWRVAKAEISIISIMASSLINSNIENNGVEMKIKQCRESSYLKYQSRKTHEEEERRKRHGESSEMSKA
jgi:hypothetical protein